MDVGLQPLRDCKLLAVRLQRNERRWRCAVILSEVQMVRETLVAAVESYLLVPNVVCISSLAEAARQINIIEPDMVLIDATLRDGLKAVRWFRSRSPASLLIAFNVDEAVRDTVAWGEAGISSFISRSGTLEEIIELISTQMDDNSAPDGRLLAEIDLDSTDELSSPITLAQGEIVVLTRREEQVAQLLITGESNKEIGRVLNISVPTVKSHVHNLLRKLGVQRRGKLALRCELIANTVGEQSGREK